MMIYVALLRAINLGGHRKVAMAELRDLLAQLGFDNARSLLQSGNLVFGSKLRAAAELERLLEAEVEARLACRTDCFVRTREEWKAVIAHNPFPEAAERDPAHLLVMSLKGAPDGEQVEALQGAITGPEVVRAYGRHLYIVYPVDIGHSRLTSTLIERKLGTRGTGRNWNTVLKLGALAQD
jgi:uncharacterized protein (DUF1697 family)